MTVAVTDIVILGQIVGLYGIKGWVKVKSFTDPRENIATYKAWFLQRAGKWQQIEIDSLKQQGKGLIAKINGIDDRDAASEIMQCSIGIERHNLPELDDDEYYWLELQGLHVKTCSGDDLGCIEHIIETGANDVLVVQKGDKEYLIPYIRPDVIKRIDIENKMMLVDWEEDY